MISFVQSNANGGAATVTLDGVTAGNLIVVGFYEVKYDASPSTLSCSDGTSSLTAVAESDGTYVRWRFFYLLSANSGNRTYTISGGGKGPSLTVMEFSYTGNLSLEDYSNNYADYTTSITSGNVQPSGPSLVIGGAISYAGGEYSSCQINGVAYDGLKSYVDLTDWPPMWYRIVSSGFDGAATCTTASAGWYAASAVSFLEQAAGGGIPPWMLSRTRAIQHLMVR